MRVEIPKLDKAPMTVGRTPDGDYVFVVTDVEVTTTRNSGERMVVISSKIVDVDDADIELLSVEGRDMRQWFVLESLNPDGSIDETMTLKRLGRFKKFLSDCDVAWEGDGFDDEDLIGARFIGRVGPQRDNPNFSEIKSTLPA